MHGPTARRLPLPYLQIINPLEGFVGAEDQARNKPADRFKSFRTTKDLSKTFHPLGQDLGHPNNRQHGSTLSFSISFFLSSSIHPFFPITFQVVLSGSLLKAIAAMGEGLAMGPWDKKPQPSAGRLANHLEIHIEKLSTLALEGVEA